MKNLRVFLLFFFRLAQSVHVRSLKHALGTHEGREGKRERGKKEDIIVVQNCSCSVNEHKEI